MPTYTSPEVYVSNGATTTYTVQAGITITAMRCHWKGQSTFRTVSGYTHGSVSNTAGGSGTGSASATTTFPAVPSGGTLEACNRVCTGRNLSSSVTVAMSGCVNNSWVLPGGSYQSSTMGGSPGGSCTGAISVTPAQPCSITVQAETYYAVPYSYQEETKTSKPKIVVNGKTTQYNSSINNNSWTTSQTMTAGSLIEGSNSFAHTIEGSGIAYFQFEFDYVISRPTLVHQAKAYDGSVIGLRIVNVDDMGLEYGCLRICLDGNVYAVDVVDTADSEASPIRFYTERWGTLALRKVI